MWRHHTPGPHHHDEFTARACVDAVVVVDVNVAVVVAVVVVVVVCRMWGASASAAPPCARCRGGAETWGELLH